MTSTTLRLGPVSLDVRQYAIQGNAVLGIKDSGKTYTSTFFGERLMDAGVPIVAFDPIGVWRFLRVAGKGAGYPVVVAGGKNGDLPLSPKGAPEIVRAAMRDGVSLVIDLYSLELNKADWRAIVESCVRVLLYENGAHGLRHVFIEEAAEFAPQRVGPDQGRVYAEIEKLARMGGNAMLGYTLINQRAEEVNKAVLELCDTLFLFRQKGKNSLLSLQKWLDVAGAVGAKDIVPTLPTLRQGECWAWLAGSDTPVRIPRMPEKRTLHPDRRAMHSGTLPAQAQTVDVSAFVQHMTGTLEQIVKEAEANDPKRLKARIAELERQAKTADTAELERLRGQFRELSASFEAAMAQVKTDLAAARADGMAQASAEIRAAFAGSTRKHLADLHGFATGLVETAGKLAEMLGMDDAPAMPPSIAKSLEALGVFQKSLAASGFAPRAAPPSRGPSERRAQPPHGVSRVKTPGSAPPSASAASIAGSELGKGERITLIAIAQHDNGVTREQLTVLTGYKRSTRNTYLQRLGAAGLIADSGSRLVATDGGIEALGDDFEPLPTGDALRQHVLQTLPEGERNILEVLIADYPKACDREVLSEVTGYTRSSRNTYLQRLSARELVVASGPGEVRAAAHLFD